MDEKIEARYISPEIGYGVFSKKIFHKAE